MAEQAQLPYRPVCRIYPIRPRIMVEIDDRAKDDARLYEQFLGATQHLRDSGIGHIRDLRAFVLDPNGGTRPVVYHGVECHNGIISEMVVIERIIAMSRQLEGLGWVVDNFYDKANGNKLAARIVLD